MKNLKTLGFSCLAAIFAFAISSCSTVKGFGQDLEKAGQAIEKNAS